jgi:hypothetical protein
MHWLRWSALFAFTTALAAAAVPGYADNALYQTMAPASAYLIADRQAEIALAKSAAPASISDGATILVLGPQGYETAVAGTNGFTCLVERSWDAAFDWPEFWNPSVRGPDCFNPAASRSVVPFFTNRARMALAGTSKSDMLAKLQAAAGTLPTPEPGAMCYMMSKQQYLGDTGKSWAPHLMFFAPKADRAGDGAAWGANLDGSPVVYDSSTQVMPEPFAIFMLPVGHWSDGTKFK